MAIKIDASTQTEIKHYTIEEIKEAIRLIKQKEEIRTLWEKNITENFLKFW